MNDTLMSELITQLDHSDSQISQQAKVALLQMGAVVVEPLIKVVLGESENLRSQAADILFQLDDPRCIEPMLEALKSPNLMLEHIAIEVLQRFDVRELAPALIQALPHCHCSAQARIVMLLENAGDSQVVPPLVRLLETTESSLLRLCIIQTLRTFGGRQVIEAIRAFLDDKDTHVQKRARSVLEYLENRKDSFNSLGER